MEESEEKAKSVKDISESVEQNTQKQNFRRLQSQMKRQDSVVVEEQSDMKRRSEMSHKELTKLEEFEEMKEKEKEEQSVE